MLLPAAPQPHNDAIPIAISHVDAHANRKPHTNAIHDALPHGVCNSIRDWFTRVHANRCCSRTPVHVHVCVVPCQFPVQGSWRFTHGCRAFFQWTRL